MPRNFNCDTGKWTEVILTKEQEDILVIDKLSRQLEARRKEVLDNRYNSYTELGWGVELGPLLDYLVKEYTSTGKSPNEILVDMITKRIEIKQKYPKIKE